MLCSLMLDSSVASEISRMLHPEDFYSDSNACLYRHVLAMADETGEFDPTLFLERMRRNGDLERIGGAVQIAEVLQAVAVPSHVKYYAKIVKEKAALRRVIKVATDMLVASYADKTSAKELAAEADESLRKVTYDSAASPSVDAKDALLGAWHSLQRKKTGVDVCVKTGINGFDNLYGGLFAGELAVLAARPGIGKTSLAMGMSLQAAGDGFRTLFVTLEMGSTELWNRNIAGCTPLSLKQLRTGEISPDEEKYFYKAANKFSLLPLEVLQREGSDVEVGGTKVSGIRRAINILNRQPDKGKIELLVVDYLGLCQPEDSRVSRQEQVGASVRLLKDIAQELRIPVLCLSQLNRQSEQKGKITRPGLSDLRDSGEIEQASDICMFIHRKRESESNGEDSNDAELIVEKHRNGPEATFPLLWCGETTSYVDRAPERYTEFDSFSDGSDQKPPQAEW